MQSFRDPDRRIGALATEQHGVVARRQLAELGLTPQHIAYRIDIGRLIRIFRGVYAVGHPRLTREGRWMGAVLTCGSRAVLSHADAAAHWELMPARGVLIDVTTPFESDRDRDQVLMLAGYRVVRFTYNQLIRQPAKSAARLRDLLAGSGSRNDE